MPSDISQTAGAQIHRKKQAALATFYKGNPIQKPLDNSTLLDLEQGRALCCCTYPPVTIIDVTQRQTPCPTAVTVTWVDDPNAISYEILLQVITGDPGEGSLFEEPTRSSVTGNIVPTIQVFKIGIRAVYPCGNVVSWTEEVTLTGCIG